MSTQETLELTLTRLDATRVEVYCNGYRSHHFELSTLPPDDSQQPGHFLIDRSQYGETLYQLLFPERTAAHDVLLEKPNRLLFIIADEILDAVAWEYLRSPRGFLAEEISIVRGLPPEERVSWPNNLGELHIVAVPSNPLSKELPQLSIDEEWRQLCEIVNALPYRCLLERTRPPNIERLRSLLLGRTGSVVHFIGHGSQDKQGAYLCFEQYNGAEDRVNARHFVERLKDCVFLVTLNACLTATSGPTLFSNLAAALVREKVPYALGMRAKIPNCDAQNFTHVFYSELASGTTVEEALRQARLSLSAHPSLQWCVGIPILYTSLSAIPAAPLASAGMPDINERQPRIEVNNALLRAIDTFIGRIDELQKLGNKLTGYSRPRIINVYGTGGQGKTALVQKAVERFAFAWSGGVWAATFETLPTRAAFARNLARFLGIDAQSIVDSDEVESLIVAHFERQHERILLVLDNLETLMEAIKGGNDADNLNRFIMRLPSPSVSLLITSRLRLGWPGEESIHLDGLSDEEGAKLFRTCASLRQNEITSSGDWELLKSLSNKLKGHPLGLRLLGGAFNKSPVLLETFFRDYEQQLLSAEVIALEPRHRSLRVCFETSVRYLSDDQKRLLGCLWIFEAPFRAETATTVLDSVFQMPAQPAPSIHSNLYNLSERGLLEREVHQLEEGDFEFYGLLPVVRSYIKKSLPLQIDKSDLFDRFGKEHARIVQGIYEDIERGNLVPSSLIVEQTYANLESGAKYVRGLEQGNYYMYLGWINYKLGGKLREPPLLEQALEILPEQEPHGDMREALRLFENARLIMQEIQDYSGEAKILNTMAKMYKQIGEPYKALDLYVEVMDIMQETGDKLGEIQALNDLAVIYQATGRSEEAYGLLAEALSIVHEVGSRSVKEAISSVEMTIAVLEQAGLSQDTDGQTVDAIRKDLQLIREGVTGGNE